MFRKSRQLAAGAAMLLLSFGAHAQWTAGVSYTDASIDDFKLGAIVASIGYRFPITDTFALVPEVRAGFGVGDDTRNIGGVLVTAEVDTLYGFSNRFQYEFPDTNFVMFGVASYVNYEFTAKGNGVSVSDDTWEFGYGGGAGYMFTPRIGGEASYERVDGEDLFTIGARFKF